MSQTVNRPPARHSVDHPANFLAQISTFLILSSFSLVPHAPAQTLNTDGAGGLSGGSVYVFRINNRYELSVPPVEDVQRVWEWLNPADPKDEQTSTPPKSLDRSIGEFLQNRPQPASELLLSD